MSAKLTMRFGCCALALVAAAGVMRARDAAGRPPQRGGFERLDTDGDGVLSEAEFNRAPFAKEFSVAAFGLADTDGGGTVSPEELHVFMQAVKFSKMDADGDGKLSETEFNAMSARGGTAAFTEVDTDVDGYVTLVEFQAMRMPPPPTRATCGNMSSAGAAE